MKKDIFFSEGNVITEDYIGSTIIPRDTKIDCYINFYGVNSNNSKGHSVYYIIDQEITMAELIRVLEAKHAASVSNDTMELIVDSSEDESEYDFISEVISPIEKMDKKFRYQMLDRLRSDCEYYLGYGNRCKKHLWAGDEKRQIRKMKAIYDSFSDSEKPEWLTSEQILVFEKEMCR